MQHIYKRRAVCSVLHGQLVCVRRVVHVVGHIGHNLGENVLEVVHIVPYGTSRKPSELNPEKKSFLP